MDASMFLVFLIILSDGKPKVGPFGYKTGFQAFCFGGGFAIPVQLRMRIAVSKHPKPYTLA
jgi:hypothetical protein